MERLVRIADQGDSDRSSFSQRELELAEPLRRWDPIGVYAPEDKNPDETEYDDLVRPLMLELESGTQPERLTYSLKKTFRRDYSLDDPEGLELFCVGLFAWWKETAEG